MQTGYIIRKFELFVFFAFVLPTMIGVSVQFYAITDYSKIFSSHNSGHIRPTADDTAFGGTAADIAALNDKLQSRTAGTKGGRHRARSLAVAIVSVGGDGNGAGTGSQAVRRPVIDIDFARAEDSAILVIADRPVAWTASNTQGWHRGVLAVEGAAIFDLGPNVPDGLLADYRIKGFGATDATSTQDVEPGAVPGSMRRFCGSIERWAEYYGVPASKVRLWRLDSPSRINLDRGHIMQNGRIASGTEYVANMC